MIGGLSVPFAPHQAEGNSRRRIRLEPGNFIRVSIL